MTVKEFLKYMKFNEETDIITIYEKEGDPVGFIDSYDYIEHIPENVLNKEFERFEMGYDYELLIYVKEEIHEK